LVSPFEDGRQGDSEELKEEGEEEEQ
jgi:hypothetical protein